MGMMHVLILTFYCNILYLTFVPFATSVSFKISSFGSNTNEIQYRGSAVPSSGAIQLNPVNYVCQTGQAVYAEKVQMWDSASGKVADFTTRFSFAVDINNTPASGYGDGFTFFIGPADFQIPPNSAGSFFGLYNLSNYRESSQNQMIHVEFDSFVDSDWDPAYQHVGINKNSIFSANYTTWSPGNHSGDAADVVVSYNAKDKMLIVTWTYKGPTSPESSSLSYQVDLKEVLPEWVIVGFSAGTGTLTEKNTLLYWEFDSTLNGKWQDPQQKAGNSKSVNYFRPVVIGVAIGIAIASIVGIAVTLKILKMNGIKLRRRKLNEAIPLIGISSSGDSTGSEARTGLINYSFSDLYLATNGFADDHKLGEGGFGGVYKGRLPISIHKQVAVKKISESSTQGEKEFTAEVAIISKLNHPNLVELVGSCVGQGMFLLVYKHIENGSLDSHLFGKKDPLVWSNRYKIAKGLAYALRHLHEEQGDGKCIIHRDIKPSNVMLDSEFNPKLGDFGLARLLDSNGQGSKTTIVAGTPGYCAPEYLSSRIASKATDMFSFGVTLLEIGSGRSVGDQTPNLGLVKWVWDLYGKKKLRSTVDKRLSSIKDVEYNCLMIVGLSCTHPDENVRSTIKQVIHALEKVIPPEVPLEMPIARYDAPTNHPSTSGANS